MGGGGVGRWAGGPSAMGETRKPKRWEVEVALARLGLALWAAAKAAEQGKEAA